MNGRRAVSLVWMIILPLASLASADTTMAQAPRQSGTLAIEGQPAQVPLVRINGKSYVDIESLARLTHGSLRFEGPRTVLILPGAGVASELPAASNQNGSPGLTQGFLDAQIVALSQLSEWHAALVNAVNNSLPVTAALIGPVERQAEAKLQLALAATASGPDQRSAELLRNEFANMQQMSNQLQQTSTQGTHIPPDVFNNNALDAKIVGCQNSLAQMAASKQFQDDAQCH